MSARAWALAAFDELFVGYADRSAAIDPAQAGRIAAFDVLGPVVVIDGRLVGTWKRQLVADRVLCSVSPLAPLSDAQQAAVQSAFARYARFLGRDLET